MFPFWAEREWEVEAESVPWTRGSDAPPPLGMLCPVTPPQLCPPASSNAPSALQLSPVEGLKQEPIKLTSFYMMALHDEGQCV